ncbi:MAG: FxLYD domain-containing protein [Bryobacteraceae bacterium]
MIIGSPKKNTEFPTGIVIALAVVLLIGGAAAWYFSQPRDSANQPPVLTPEARAYVKNLKLSGVELKATDSAMAKSLIEIVGNITNTGDRKLKLVELNCVFYDPYNQLVLRERVAIVRPRTGGLAPTETKPFRMPFDNMPGSWNQAMPQLVIAQIQFE